MMGRKTGVGVQMKSKYSPFMAQTHCIAHRLNLACVDSIKKNKTFQTFKDKFNALYIHISSSSNRTYKLKKIQKLLEEPELTVKQPHSIRWLGLKNAVEAVFECFVSIIATLSALAAENDPTAKGLLDYFSQYKTALLVAFMFDVHTVVGILSKQLQKQCLLFSEIEPLMDATLAKLDFLETKDGDGLKQIKESIQITEEKAYIKGEKLKNYKKSSNKEFNTARSKYVTDLKTNIKARFRKDDSELFHDFSVLLEPVMAQEAEEEECEDALKALASFYGSGKTNRIVEGDLVEGTEEREEQIAPLLDEDGLKKEWPALKGMIEGTYSSLSTEKLCKRVITVHGELLPNFARLCCIALCISVTSVECERSFSTQNRLKSKYRASLSPEKLDHLMLIASCGPSLSLFKPATAIRLWQAKKVRRKARLSQPYQPRTKKPKC